MATAKVNGLIFEGWWRENVVVEKGASVSFPDLFLDYRRAVVSPMGRQAFVARLNGLKIRETKRNDGTRMRWGVRLRVEADAELHSRPRVTTDAFRITPYVPGASEPFTAFMLQADTPAEASAARVAMELHRERCRQSAPVAEGGEGWSASHDDTKDAPGDLANAAAAYAYAAAQPEDLCAFLELNEKRERQPSRRGWMMIDFLREVWPWDVAWWKPKTDAPGWQRRCLVKAGALIIAAIEKRDRADLRAKVEADEARQMTGV